MKSQSQRFHRTAADVAARVEKFVSELRPAMQAKHQLTGECLDKAISRGVALAMIAIGQKANTLETPMAIPVDSAPSVN